MAGPLTPPGMPEYDAMRRRLQNQYAQRRQDTGDAIQRRFASTGMLNSGAHAKSLQKANMELDQAQNDAGAQLELAQAQEAQRRLEVQQGREYATKEREAAQAFNKQMFDQDLGFKRETFQKEFDQNVKTNELSALVNLIGDDFDNPEKRAKATEWLSGFWNGGGSQGMVAQAQAKAAAGPQPNSWGKDSYGNTVYYRDNGVIQNAGGQAIGRWR